MVLEFEQIAGLKWGEFLSSPLDDERRLEHSLDTCLRTAGAEHDMIYFLCLEWSVCTAGPLEDG